MHTARQLVGRCSGARCSQIQSMSLGTRAGAASGSASEDRFAFVHAELEKHDLIAHSREALRCLGKDQDSVRLHLPSSASSSAVHASWTASGLALSHIAVVEIHNPAARNALSGKMMAQLADIVTQLEDPAVHSRLNAVVLTGTGGWFCAGADLQVAKQELSSSAAGTAMGTLMVDTLTRFRRLPLVSVALVEGGAYGGGAELSTACDFRIMEKSAVIQFVQAKMGVSPGWGGGARLYKLVGRQQALRLLCAAEKVTSTRAVAIQLVDSLFDKENETAASAVGSFLVPFDSVPSGTREHFMLIELELILTGDNYW